MRTSSIRFYTSTIANNTAKDTVLAYSLSLNYVETWTTYSISYNSSSLAGLHYWLYDTGSEIIITNDQSNYWGPSKLTISQIQSVVDTLTEPYYIGLNKSNASDSGSGNDNSTFTSCEVFLRSKADMVANGVTFVDKVINGKTFSVPSNWNDDHIDAPAFTGLPEPFHTVGGGGRNAIYILDTGGSDEKDIEFQNERMRIDKEGNVGIGTNNPQSKLEIGGNNVEIRLSRPTNSGGITKLRQDYGETVLVYSRTDGDGNDTYPPTLKIKKRTFFWQ